MPATTTISSAPQNGSKMSSAKTLKLILFLALSIAVTLSLHTWFPLHTAMICGLSVFCITVWASQALPEYLPALGFFLFANLAQLAPANVVFSGFYSSTFWLLFSGLIIGAAIRFTGLDKRLSSVVAPLLGKSYLTILTRLAIISLALAFIMPSSVGRIMLLLPLVSALATEFGYGDQDRGRYGMITVAVWATWLPAFSILPANTPNMILSGMVEAIYQDYISYWDYLSLHFPILGLLKTALIIGLTYLLFRAPNPSKLPQKPVTPAPLSVAEKHLILILMICLGLWVSDNLHHISPGWIGLAAALYCLMPHTKLTSPKTITQDVNFSALLFIAAIIGLGATLSYSNIGSEFVAGLTQILPLGDQDPLYNLTLVTIMGNLVALLTNLPGVPSIMTPLAADLSTQTGLSLITILMTQVFAFSNIFLPYQAPPLMMAIQLGKLPAAKIMKLCLILFAITSLCLFPLTLLWWSMLELI